VTIDSRRGDQHAIRVDRRADRYPAYQPLGLRPLTVQDARDAAKGVGSTLRPVAVETVARINEVVPMLVRTDPFRDFDRLAQQALGGMTRPAVMAMDAWRDSNEFVVAFDLPGVRPDSIDIDVEGNVLTVEAERQPPSGADSELVAAERPSGVFSRQLIVSDTLDTEHIQASYDAGVLTLRIPIAEKAKPRRIAVTTTGAETKVIEGSSAEQKPLVGATA
jgi:HSP20 family protein